MELQNEEKRKVCKRRRTQSKSASSLPLDLASEILLRLPEKSVAKLRCVSKRWLSITTDPYFINLFETTRNPRPSLLLCFKEDDKMVVSTIRQHHQTLQDSKRSYTSSHPIDRYHMKSPEFGGFHHPTESVHGLICFQVSATPIVWNPSTRQILTLPKPGIRDPRIVVLLGYDPIEGKHKVVCKSFSISDECRVLTLGSSEEESWRTVKTKHMHRVTHYTSGRCIKGVVYYLADVSRKGNFLLMSFDVQSEKVNMIQIQEKICWEPFITYEGRVACAGSTWENRLTLHILEDAEEGKWSVKRLVAPVIHYDHSLKVDFKLKSMTHGGEFIYAPCSFHKSRYILFCDPERNSFRRFQLQMLSYGDVCYPHQLYAFPDHFESQMSL